MRYVVLGFKLFILSYLIRLLVFLIGSYDPALPGYAPPFGLFVIDTINLFIHEAGHFFFKIFGQWMYVLGGSLFQCLLPLALLVVTWRQNVGQTVYPGFWLGENMVNVSVYIRDAPFKQLRLIAKGLIHDWNWLLAGDLDSAEPLGLSVYWIGAALCTVSVLFGVWTAFSRFIEEN
jgi:hypothetical protein